MPLQGPNGYIEDGTFTEDNLAHSFQETPVHDRSNYPLFPTANAFGLGIQVEFLNTSDPNLPYYVAGLGIVSPIIQTGIPPNRIITPSPLVTATSAVPTLIPPSLSSGNLSETLYFFTVNSGKLTVDFSVPSPLTIVNGGEGLFPPTNNAVVLPPPYWLKAGIWNISTPFFPASGNYTGGANPPAYGFTGNCVINVYMIQLGSKVAIFNLSSTLNGPVSPPNYLNTHSSVTNTALFPALIDTSVVFGNTNPWSLIFDVVSFSANPFVDGSDGRYPFAINATPSLIYGQ